METTNTIVEYNIAEQNNIEYEGLYQSALKAMEYLIKCYSNETPFSACILGMKDELGYVLHPESFIQGYIQIIDMDCIRNPEKQETIFANILDKDDDLKLFTRAGDTIEAMDDINIKYESFEKLNNIVYEKPIFSLIESTNQATEMPIPDESTSVLTQMRRQIRAQIPPETVKYTPVDLPVEYAEIKKTTNTICEFYFPTRKVEYIGLKESANKALQYIAEAYAKELPFTEIIKNMPDEIGYTLHQDSFDLALRMIFDTDPSKEKFIMCIRKMDDLDLYEKIDAITLQQQQDAFTKYVEYVYANSMDHIGKVPQFELDPSSVPVLVPNTPENTYINLPAKEPEPDHPSGFGGTPFEFDTPNKQILLYTVIVFLAIRVIAYYYKDDSEKSSENTQDEALNSAYETVYLDPTLLINILISLIPIWLVIIYKLRYYYYYKFLRLKKQNDAQRLRKSPKEIKEIFKHKEILEKEKK